MGTRDIPGPETKNAALCENGWLNMSADNKLPIEIVPALGRLGKYHNPLLVLVSC